MIKKERNSSLELLRIISMILIVGYHYSLHGFDRTLLDYNYNKYILDILMIGGKLGVNCFVLISAYFMIESKITLKKLMKLSPYLNKFIKMIGKDVQQKLILVLIFMWSIIMMVFPKSDLGFSNLGWFILLYLIASYIRLYINVSSNYKCHLKRLFIGFAIYLVSILIFNLVGNMLNNKFLLKINKLSFIIVKSK